MNVNFSKHSKLTVIKEYCKARRIPYKFEGESLYLDKKFFCFSIYNLPYDEMFSNVDSFVEYDEYGYFTRLKNS